MPDLIVGDFDSILGETYDYFVNKKVRMVKTPDQNRTDLTKCLSFIVDIVEQRHLNVSFIITFCPNALHAFA